MEVSDLIEIIGILFDNAVEAVECQENKKIEVKLLNEHGIFIFSVANASNRKTNSEIIKTFGHLYFYFFIKTSL